MTTQQNNEEVEIMGKSVSWIKQTTDDNLKHQNENKENELVTALVENMIKTKITVLKSDKTEKPQKTSLDVLLLIDEFKSRFEKLGEKAREIAQKDGRTVVTYDDADKALRQIRAGKG